MNAFGIYLQIWNEVIYIFAGLYHHKRNELCGVRLAQK